MTTTTRPSALDRINRMQEEAQEAAKKRAEYVANGGDSKSAYVLRMENIISLQSDERVLIRPLYNMDAIFIRRIHDQFKNIAADGSKDPLCHMCAEENGQACALCATGHNDKKELKDEAFIPVGLYYQQSDVSGSWQVAPYVDKEGVVHVKRGWRMLRVKATSPIFQQLMNVYNNPKYHNDITGCDFEIVRRGATMNDTKYTCTPQPPETMSAKAQKGKPSLAQLKDVLNKCFPSRIVDHSPVVNGSIASQDDPFAEEPIEISAQPDDNF